MINDFYARRLNYVNNYAQLWRATEILFQESTPAAHVALFLEIINQRVPRLIHSTDGFYENLPPEHLQEMVQTSPILAFLNNNPGREFMEGHEWLGDDPQTDSHFAKFLSDKDWRYFVCLAFWSEDNELQSGIILSRSENAGPFTAEEKKKLRELRTHLAPTLRRLRANYARIEREQAIQHWLSQSCEPRILTAHNGEILAITGTARKLLKEWTARSDIEVEPLPATGLPAELHQRIGLLNVRAFLAIAEGRRIDPKEDYPVRVPSPSGRLEALIQIRPPRHILDWPSFSITLQPAGGPSKPVARLPPLLPYLETHRLTPSEILVLGAVLEGLDNASIARRLDRETGTIKAQIASAFRKLGFRSRNEFFSHCLAALQDAAG